MDDPLLSQTLDDEAHLVDWPSISDEVISILAANPRFSPDLFEHPFMWSTMFYIKPHWENEYAELRLRPGYRTGWAHAVEPSRVELSNTVHLAYHLHRFNQATGVSILDAPSIVEIGGGYGGLCALIRRLGSMVPYTIVDLPGMLRLQHAYLVSQDTARRPILTSSWSPHLKGGALIATWSLSEADEALRLAVLGSTDQFRDFLFAYQPQFHGNDNVSYFTALRASRPDVHWHEETTAASPESRYLFGSSR